MFGGKSQAQSTFLELVKNAIKSEAAFKNISDEVANSCVQPSIPM